MTPKTKGAVMMAGFSLLGVLAVAGWTRNPAATNMPGNNFASPGVYSASYAQPVAQPVYDQYGQAVNCSEPVVTNAAYAPAPTPQYQTYNRPRVIRETNYVERAPVTERRTVARQKRSTGKSVAIVGGSAGVGAAVGALAGGGKGAGIGALTGGAAGFIYDRLTHNR